jgi:predicted dehydrogenase
LIVSVTQRLKAAVIGVGYLGNFHVQKYAALEDVELVAVVDADPAVAGSVAAKVSAEGHTDYSDILGRVDLVSIVVPTEFHYPIARDCLEAGVHVLLEKPMTSTVEQAAKLTQRARERGLVLQIGHLERFNPAIMTLQGALSNPFFIESHRMAQFKPRGTDVSVVLDLMIHDIDIILSMVNSDITAIRPAGFPVLSDEVDIANVRLEFANGCVANVTASRVSQNPMRKIRVFQADAYFSIDYVERRIAVCRRVADPDNTQSPYRLAQEEKNFAQADTLMLEIRAFVDAVKQGTPPVVSGEDGKRALEVALTIAESLKAIRVPPDGLRIA